MQGRAEKVAWVQVRGFKNQVAELKEKLASIQAELLLVETKSEEQGLNDKSDKIWEQEDQQEKLNYLRFGNRNTKFFHLTAIQRRQRNQIIQFKDENAICVSSASKISKIVKTYFLSLSNVDQVYLSDVINSVLSIAYFSFCNWSVMQTGRELGIFFYFDQKPISLTTKIG